MAAETNKSAGDFLIEKRSTSVKEDKDISAGQVLQSHSNPETFQDSIETIQNPGSTVDGLGFQDKQLFQVSDNAKFGQFTYKMNHKERGCFLIFNQENFDGNVLPRVGSKIDARNIFEAVSHLGFEYVNTFHDLRRQEILQWITRVAKASHANYDCFGCAILSHGEEGDVIHVKDGLISLTELTEPFNAKNCPSLAGKPKLFFVQSCRGTKFDEGMKLEGGDVTDGFTNVMDDNYKTIPVESDFLIAHSTVSGYVAWLNSANGSWFIQCLCICIIQFGKTLDFLKVLTRVNNMVSHGFESSSTNGNDKFKQVPSIATRLTADLCFGKLGCETCNGNNDHINNSEIKSNSYSNNKEIHPPNQPAVSSEIEVSEPRNLAEETPPIKPKKSTLMSRLRKSFRRKR